MKIKRVMIAIIVILILALIIFYGKEPRLSPDYCRNLVCSNWENFGCGLSNCDNLEMLQKRNCTRPDEEEPNIQREYDDGLGGPGGIQLSHSYDECEQQCILSESTCNTPPTEPSNPNPSNNSINASTNLVLGWDCLDIDNQNLTYDIYFGTTQSPLQVSNDQTENTFNTGTLNYSTTYYWHIVVTDGINTITGPTWSFTTEPEPITNIPPNLPFDPLPSQGSINNSVNLTLTWNATDPDNDSLTYDLYINSELIPDLALKSYSLTNLDYDSVYYWQVYVKDNEFITQGPIWNFSTEPEIISTTNETNQTIIEKEYGLGVPLAPLFDIKVFLEDKYLEVYPGDNVEALIALYNFGTLRPVDVFLECSLEDMEKNKLDHFSETLAVDLQTSIYRQLNLPKDAPIAKYVYSCYLTYKNETITSSELFSAVEPPVIEKRYPFNFSILIFIIIAAILIIITFIKTYYDKYKSGGKNGKRKDRTTKTTSRKH